MKKTKKANEKANRVEPLQDAPDSAVSADPRRTELDRSSVYILFFSSFLRRCVIFVYRYIYILTLLFVFGAGRLLVEVR